MSNDLRLDQQERTILEITELVCKLMEEQNVSRSQLADRLGLPDWHINQILNGQVKMPIRTISDIFTALGHTLCCKAEKIV